MIAPRRGPSFVPDGPTTLEVADIIRRAGDQFFQRYRDSLTWTQLKALRAIECCRTAALGGHRDQCVRCGHPAISYNSCLMGSFF